MRPISRAGFLTVLAICVSVFWRTAFPTITWWDSSQYSLAASTLGIAGPPGSLLLTLLGWPVAHLPFGASAAYRLNLLAGALAALSAALVYLVANRLLIRVGHHATGAVAFGAVLGALTFAFGATTWEHAVKFTPYILTAVFTGLILWALVHWWDGADQQHALRRLAVVALLFGLDFSVHRTNALLIPAAIVWIAMRDPRAFVRARTWVVGIGSLVAGLSVQLLLIPIAQWTRSPLNWTDPTSLQRLWDYVSLKQLGGGFLVELMPRKAPFWSVQVTDFLRVLSANFLRWSGPTRAAGTVAAVAAAFGLVVLWRRERRLGLAFTLVLLLQSAATVLYFNIPANFFRSLDRHYLPVCVTLGVAIACGLGSAMQWIAVLARSRQRIATAACCVLLLLAPAAQLADGWHAADGSRRYFTGDYARNALQALPPHAIYFTVGDNDTFPVLYVQAVEGVRRDVQILNLSMANAEAYLTLLRRLDPTFPMVMSREGREAARAAAWTDTLINLPVAGAAPELGLPRGSATPATISLRVKPTFGDRMLIGDLVLLDIVRTNAWRRPLTFAISAQRGGMSWLEPYGRLDGLFWRIVPTRNPPVSDSLLRDNLSRNVLRGYADTSVVIEDVTRNFGVIYHQAVAVLLDAESANRELCLRDLARLLAAVPPQRLGPAAIRSTSTPSGCS